MEVRLRDGRSFSARPNNRVFTVDRVWSENLERGLFGKVESVFQQVADDIVAGGVPSNLRPVLEYLAVWQIRAELARNPPADVRLRFPGAEDRKPYLSKDEEERLEAHGRVHGRNMGIGVAYLRGDMIPGRIACEINVRQQFDALTWPTLGFEWKILRSSSRQFICSDTPDAKLFIPLSPTIAVFGSPLEVNQSGSSTEIVIVTDEQVGQLNERSKAGCDRLVFGAPGALG